MNLEILFSLSYGMFALGVKGDDGPNACIVNTVSQITVDPATVSVSVHHDNYTNTCMKKTGRFTVSVFSEETPGSVIGALGFFSGRDQNKIQKVKHTIRPDGTPVIDENICCWFNCEIVDSIETDTHTLFVGKVVDGSDSWGRTPMTYDYYHKVIKGKAPKNAPTYRGDIEKKVVQQATPKTTPTAKVQYVCSICGYVYDGSDGPFEQLPDTWECPVCHAPKAVFEQKSI